MTLSFTRGIDTVHVTIGSREVTGAKVRLWLVFGGPGLIILLLWPLLIVGGALLLVLAGRLNVIEQDTRDQAECEALRHLERFESDRWRAPSSVGRPVMNDGPVDVYIDSVPEIFVPELALKAEYVLEERWNGWS